MDLYRCNKRKSIGYERRRRKEILEKEALSKGSPLCNLYDFDQLLLKMSIQNHQNRPKCKGGTLCTSYPDSLCQDLDQSVLNLSTPSKMVAKVCLNIFREFYWSLIGLLEREKESNNSGRVRMALYSSTIVVFPCPAPHHINSLKFITAL